MPQKRTVRGAPFLCTFLQCNKPNCARRETEWPKAALHQRSTRTKYVICSATMLLATLGEHRNCMHLHVEYDFLSICGSQHLVGIFSFSSFSVFVCDNVWMQNMQALMANNVYCIKYAFPLRECVVNELTGSFTDTNYL